MVFVRVIVVKYKKQTMHESLATQREPLPLPFSLDLFITIFGKVKHRTTVLQVATVAGVGWMEFLLFRLTLEGVKIINLAI